MTELDLPSNQGILAVAVEAAEREYRQIQSWMRLRESHPFGDDADKFAGQLKEMINRALITLNQAKADIRDGQVAAAWERCAELQRDQLPGLANELLAVIGGLYLTTNHLDDMRPLDPDGKPVGARELSFSSVARGLLDDLSQRANKLRGSLLIVGEERQVPAGADIVRLRFPACDLWDLPFTAHEYGYLIAQREPQEIFGRLKTEVEQNMDSRTHPDRELDDAGCYLLEVRQLRESYDYRDPASNEGLPGPGEEDLRDMRDLKRRQVAHLCRLFADAFATYFVGPAYVHALLRLRFRPDRTLLEPAGTIPAFTERFVFAFETLRRMDETDDLYRDLDFDSYITPFAREVNETSGLMNDWRIAVEDAGTTNTYDEVKDRFKPWIDIIWRSLTNPAWRDTDGHPEVYRYWRQALMIAQKLGDSEFSLETRPHPWAVVNAAWLARTHGDDSLAGPIETNALRLLDPEDTEVIAQRTSRQAPKEEDPRRARPRESERDHDIEIVQNALARDNRLLLFFLQDAESGGTLKLRREILGALVQSESSEGQEAYKRLSGLLTTGVQP